MNVPSIKQAEELKECCSREWDKETKNIIIKGPNGNCIFFHCSYDDAPFWLNSNERDIMGKPIYYGHCYHLGKDKHFDINDKEEHSLIGLHLVKYTQSMLSESPRNVVIRQGDTADLLF